MSVCRQFLEKACPAPGEKAGTSNKAASKSAFLEADKWLIGSVGEAGEYLGEERRY